MKEKQKNLKELPSINEFINSEEFKNTFSHLPLKLQKHSARKILELVREQILCIGDTPQCIKDVLCKKMQWFSQKWKDFNYSPVVNGTGVLLHTNLGRALLPGPLWEKAKPFFESYCDLELDIETGKRGERHRYVEEILCALFHCEDALVVNNNAASVLVALNTLAQEKEVIVSRGELVEIGGSFRIPDVMKASGVLLKEVGTTNKTKISDYEKAIHSNTALLLKVHQSNFKQSGFTHSVSLESLVALGKSKNIPVMFNLGSGQVVSYREEPTVEQCLQTGVDIISLSGDKLLGGPQAGILLGSIKVISQMKKNPLVRALRMDKIGLFILGEFLKLYCEDDFQEKIPTLKMLCETGFQTKEKIERFLKMISSPPVIPRSHLSSRKCPRSESGAGSALSGIQSCDFKIIETKAQGGGGSLPDENIESFGLMFFHPKLKALDLAKFFRNKTPSILGRIIQNHFVLDFKTIQEKDFEVIKNVFSKL
ncbi:MAG: L-seryl-tRNA(Sec) selenium transferase [Deltaproteobacteria bacterium]|nr:L-seryl-tRNA(Sec) selenium transferase [Deltaproteobacteria bacterium]